MIVDALRSFAENLSDKLSLAKESLGPKLKLALLAALILTMVLLILLVLLSMPSAPVAAKSSTTLEIAQQASIYGTDFSLGPSTQTTVAAQGIDPFLKKPILPPEPRLYLGGEIELSRPPQSYWSIEDLEPFWPSLKQDLQRVLREQNQKDFLRLLKHGSN